MNNTLILPSVSSSLLLKKNISSTRKIESYFQDCLNKTYDSSPVMMVFKKSASGFS